MTEVKETAGLTRNQAMKNPALWLLILMAGMFVISASFVQQLASYASVTDGLGAAVGAMAVSVAMVTSMIGKFGLRQNESGEVVLLNDIDLSGVTEWTPIGSAKSTGNPSYKNPVSPFTGVFNGQGYAITGIR